MPSLKERYAFFRENAGYVVGERAKGALRLARAEAALRAAMDAGQVVIWWESDPFADDSFVETWDERSAKAWRDQEHEALECRLVRPCERCQGSGWNSPETCRHAETLASLSGIFDPDTAYMRVVEAELALEASFGPS